MDRITLSLVVIKYSHFHWQNRSHQMQKTVSWGHTLFLHEYIIDSSVHLTLENVIFQNKLSMCSVLLAPLWQQNTSNKFLHRNKFQIIMQRHQHQQGQIATPLGFPSGSTVLRHTISPANVCYFFYTPSQCVC